LPVFVHFLSICFIQWVPASGNEIISSVTPPMNFLQDQFVRFVHYLSICFIDGQWLRY